MSRVGQNHIYTMYIRFCFGREITKYTVIRCIYTGLANPTNERYLPKIVPRKTLWIKLDRDTPVYKL